jgi:hypothetical protein
MREALFTGLHRWHQEEEWEKNQRKEYSHFTIHGYMVDSMGLTVFWSY